MQFDEVGHDTLLSLLVVPEGWFSQSAPPVVVAVIRPALPTAKHARVVGHETA
jgi:hypothetical protein